MQKYLPENFLSKRHNGLINDVEVVFIDKTELSDLTRGEELSRTRPRQHQFMVWMCSYAFLLCLSWNFSFGHF